MSVSTSKQARLSIAQMLSRGGTREESDRFAIALADNLSLSNMLRCLKKYEAINEVNCSRTSTGISIIVIK